MRQLSPKSVTTKKEHWRHEWRLRDEYNEYDLVVNLPCDAISALYEASLIPDPYFGRNEYELRWIAERDWILEKNFELESDHYDLVLSELDTVAKVFINEQCVLQCENQFRRYRVDVSDAIRAGQNTIKIVLCNSIKVAAEKQNNQPWFVPWHQGNCPIPNGNMLRKVQCDFGWDWNIALAPLGIYGDCYLQSHETQRIENIRVSQSFTDDMKRVTVLVDIAIVSNTPNSFTLSSTLCGQTENIVIVESENHLMDGFYRASTQMSFSIENPELWWPNGLGTAKLHRLIVKTNSEEQERKIGFRRIELVTDTDPGSQDNTDKRTSSENCSFYFRVNGVAIFCKGANWIPADALPARITNEKTLGLLQSAVDANMNMIRVWGGGRYENDHFYDSCDQLGLLVWQDFMFSCNLYPHTEEFLSEVTAEVRDVVQRLQHHCSIAVWCGDNELVGALTWFKESLENRDRYLVAYDRLNHTIERTLFQEAPDSIWWPSSPSSGRLNFGDAWHDDQSGDMHFWSVWHEGQDFEHYRDVRPRFCSEFGFQSYPSMPIIESFTTENDQNIASPVMESHQKNVGGNARIAETMFRYFRFPNGFENFVYLSQIQQGIAIKTAVDYWRSEKPHCMGSLYWQLNDTWPVASWSSLNYGGSWKHLHHMARRFYRPTTVLCIPNSSGWDLIATTDLRYGTHLKFSIGAVSLNGDIRFIKHGIVSLTSRNNERLSHLGPETLNDNEWLFWSWIEEPLDSEDTHTDNTLSTESQIVTDTNTWMSTEGSHSLELLAPKPYKSYALPDANINLSVTETEFGCSLILTCLRPAAFVTIEANLDGHLSDNAFALLPGFSKQVNFIASASALGKPPAFVIRDLQTATQ